MCFYGVITTPTSNPDNQQRWCSLFTEQWKNPTIPPESVLLLRCIYVFWQHFYQANQQNLRITFMLSVNKINHKKVKCIFRTCHHCKIKTKINSTRPLTVIHCIDSITWHTLDLVISWGLTISCDMVKDIICLMYERLQMLKLTLFLLRYINKRTRARFMEAIDKSPIAESVDDLLDNFNLKISSVMDVVASVKVTKMLCKQKHHRETQWW